MQLNAGKWDNKRACRIWVTIQVKIWVDVTSCLALLFLFPSLLQHAVFAGVCTSVLLTVSLVSMSLHESV